MRYKPQVTLKESKKTQIVSRKLKLIFFYRSVIAACKLHLINFEDKKIVMAVIWWVLLQTISRLWRRDEKVPLSQVHLLNGCCVSLNNDRPTRSFSLKLFSSSWRNIIFTSRKQIKYQLLSRFIGTLCFIFKLKIHRIIAETLNFHYLGYKQMLNKIFAALINALSTNKLLSSTHDWEI